MRRTYIVWATAIILAVAVVAVALPILEHGFASKSETDSTSDLLPEMYIKATPSEGDLVSIPAVTYVQSQDKESYVLSETDKTVSGRLEVKTPQDMNSVMNVLVDFQNPGSWMFIDSMTVSLQKDISYIILGSPGVGNAGLIVQIKDGEMKWYATPEPQEPETDVVIQGDWKVWGCRGSGPYTVNQADYYKGYVLLVDKDFEMGSDYNVIKLTHGPETANVVLQNVKRTGTDVSAGQTWQVWGTGQPSSYTVNDPDAYRPDPVDAGIIYDATSGTGVAGRPSQNIPVKTGIYDFVIDVKYKSKVSVVPDKYHGENMVSNVVFLLHEKYATVQFHANGGTGTMSNQEVNTNNNVLKINGFDAPAGKAFAGWSLTSDGAVRYTDGGTVDNIETVLQQSEPLDLYAKWAASRTVQLDQNGATKSSFPTIMIWVEGVVISDLDSIPEKDGKAFAGFYSESSGGEQVFDREGKVNASVEGFTDLEKRPVSSLFVEGNLTLYAQWADLFTVNATPGAHSTASPLSSKGNSYIDIETITITADIGYHFPVDYLEHYDVTKNGVTIARITDTALTITGRPTAATTFDSLPALTANTYTVTLNNGDGATPEPSQITVTYDSSAFTSISAPTRNNYAFTGYYTAATGGYKLIDPSDLDNFVNASVTGYLDGGKWVRDSNVEIFAQWNPFLIYDGNGNTDGSAPASESHVANDKVTIKGNTGNLTKSSMVFVGWNDNAGGTGIRYVEGEKMIMPQTPVTLYAEWIEGVVITFDRNGGSGDAYTQTVPVNVDTQLNLNKFTAPSGKTFAGWSKIKDGTIDYSDGDHIELSANTTLYANWATSRVITFNANEGSGTMPNQIVPDSVDTPLNLNKFTLTDYTFVGWVDNEESSYSDGGYVCLTSDITLTAQWAKPITVTFDANGGSGTMPDQTVPEGIATQLEANAYTRAGYTFAGWGLDAHDVVHYLDGSKIQLLANTTLYAVWERPVTVTFDNNIEGELHETMTQVVPSGSGVPLTANHFTKVGYVFVGWSTTKSGEVVYVDEAIINTLSDVTLYAKWAVPVIITFDKNKGTGSMYPQVVPSGVETPLHLNEFTNKNKAFAGWSLSSGGAVAYEDGEKITVTENTTLYAKWSNSTAKISFDKNGGSGKMATQIVPKDDPTPLHPNEFIRDGYAFMGWSESKGGPVKYVDGQKITVSTNKLTLFAHWEQMKVVKLNQYSPTKPTVSGIVWINGQTVSDLTMLPQKAGYAFGGFWTEAEGTGTMVYDENGHILASVSGYTDAQKKPVSAVFAEGDRNLYAKWTSVAGSYQVRFNANEGEGTMSNEAFTIGAPQALTANAFTKSGYAFAGWSTSAEGAVEYYNGEIVTDLSTESGSVVDLYAVWGYTLTYSGNGSTKGSAPEPKVYKEGSTVTVSDGGTLEKKGYSFISWNTKLDGTGDSYAIGSKYTMPGENSTLYPVWQVNVLTVKFHGNGNTGGTMSNQTITYGVEPYTLTANAFTRTGSIFIGWNTAADGTGIAFSDGANVGGRLETPVSSLVIYAIWGHTLTYDGNGSTDGSAPEAHVYREGSTVNVSDKGTLVKTGYVFVGWNTKSDGTGTYYAPDSDYVIPVSDSTLYAIWGHTLTYDGNGSTDGSAPAAKAYKEGLTVTVSGKGTLEKTDYSFVGWNTNATGTGTYYSPGSEYTIPANDSTLYAIWGHTLTYDGNGSTGGSAPAAKAYKEGSTVTVSDGGTLERTGYTFAGWNTKSDGKGTSYAAASEYTMPGADSILYAQWTPIPVTEVTVNETASVEVGRTVTLTYTVVPADAPVLTAVWSTSSGETATVNQNGVVTGVAAGEATITITINGNITDTCTVTVTAAS